MFSVIIPVYNKAAVLSEAIESVLHQSCTEWEMIVVNDGSGDDFDGAIAPYEQDPRIRVIRQQNGGVSVARNAGIAVAREPYLTFLDADDEWLPDHLEELERMMRCEPGAALYATAYRVLFPDGSFTENQGYFLEKDVFRVPDLFEYMELRLGGSQFVNTVASCVSAKAVEQCGPFQPGIRNGEDTDFFLRIAAYNDVALSGKVTAVYHRERSTATENGFLDYDWYFQKREAGLLQDSRIPASKREYIRLSMDRFRNHKCRHYLLDGKRALARESFAGVGKHPLIRRARLITRVMMLVPTPVLRMVYRRKKQREQE